MSFWNGREWVDEGPPATDVKREGRVKHVAKAVLEAGLITALTFGLIAGSAFAAKPSAGGGGGGKHGGGGNTTGGTSTLTVVMVDDANGNGAPNWGDTITYTVTSSSSQPYVSTKCYQGGALVYAADAGFYEGYPWPGARIMPLSSPSWTSGAASCKAYVNNTLTLSFSVGA